MSTVVAVHAGLDLRSPQRLQRVLRAVRHHVLPQGLAILEDLRVLLDGRLGRVGKGVLVVFHDQGFELSVRPRERHDQAGVVGIQLVVEAPVAADIERVLPSAAARFTGAGFPGRHAGIRGRGVVVVVVVSAVVGVSVRCAPGVAVVVPAGEQGSQRFAGFVDQDDPVPGLQVDAGRDEPLAGPVVDGVDGAGGIGGRLACLRERSRELHGAAAQSRQAQEADKGNDCLAHVELQPRRDVQLSHPQISSRTRRKLPPRMPRMSASE